MLRVLLIDRPPVAKWIDMPDADHDNPPLTLGITDTDTDPDAPVRPGSYKRSGEPRDGRWLYRRRRPHPRLARGQLRHGLGELGGQRLDLRGALLRGSRSVLKIPIRRAAGCR